ncbi:MAG: hypothetical protein IJR35_02750 [Synergistaceae bacterium]|nr:hypothetical protein [Synergistaceae bacterium]
MKTKIFLIIAILLSTCLTSEARPNLFHPDKSGDQELQALINESINKFQVKTFSDDVTGKTLQYNIRFPEDYSPEKKYPVIFFIADASAAGKDSEFSLKQGYGALVWEKYNCFVIVPFYPEVILNDETAGEYVFMTERFINYALSHYSIDTSRVYATGQSMGCMTFLLLAAKNPDLFTACLFVSGQWNIKELKGLASQKFIYITSAGDDKASAGQREVMDMFMNEGIKFDAFSEIDAKNPEITLSASQAHTFITFKKGSTLPEEADISANYSEHMSSFDYAYRIQALRDWLFAQVK